MDVNENQTAEVETTREDQIAAAEAAVTAAEAGVAGAETNVPANKEAEAAAKASAKEANDAVKSAKAALKAVGDRTDDNAEAYDAAQELVAGWEVHVEPRKTALEAATETRKGSSAAVKAAKAVLRDAKKALTAAKKVTKPKIDRVEQNGMKRPVDGGPSHKIWDAADAAAEALSRTPALGDIIKPLVDSGIKEATVKAAYAHWRKFHGITGRVESAEQIAAKAAKAAEKEAKDKAAAEAKAAKAAEAAAKAEAAKAEADAKAAEAAAAAPQPAA